MDTVGGGNKTGRFMGAIRAAMAGMERSEILERIWTAKEEKRRRGELAQSNTVLPWGVGYESGRGFFYKPEADRMRDVFSQFLAGNQSYSQLSGLRVADGAPPERSVEIPAVHLRRASRYAPRKLPRDAE